MSKCPGIHCPGCGDGGRGLVLGVIALALLAAAAWHVRRGIETGLEIVMWSIVGAVALAAAGGLVYAGLRIRQRLINNRSVPAENNRSVIPARAEVVQLRNLPAESLPQRGEKSAPEFRSAPAIEAPRPASARWPLAGQWAEINPSDERSS